MRKLLLALGVVLAVLLPGSPAWAHAQLVSSDPVKDAALAKAPTSVALVFSERLNPDFTTIVVSDAAGRRVPASTPAVDAVTGTVTLSQPLGNGVHTVAYRVVSVDGHTVQGSYTFTVTDPALPAAVPASSAPGTAAASPAGSGGIPAAVLIGLGAGGAVLALIAAFLFVTARRRAAVQPR